MLPINSESDYRIPVHQEEHLFGELRQRGLDIEFVRYPIDVHELSRGGEPILLMDRLTRMNTWFGDHA